MMMTRSTSITEKDSVKESKSKDEFKTPMHTRQLTSDNCATPTSSRNDIATSTRNLLEASAGKGVYICSICKNSESIRNNIVKNSCKSLINKLEKANEGFEASVSKVESFSSYTRNVPPADDDSGNFLSTSLTKLQTSISNLHEKIQTIEKSISSHQESMDTLNQTFSAFKTNCHNTALSPSPVSKINELFSVDRYHNRIIHGVPKLHVNPTECSSGFKQNLLPDELRASVTEFLDSYNGYADKGNRITASFGQPHYQYGTREHKQVVSIPTALNAVISLVHDQFSINDDNKINSVIICKYKGNSSHLPKQSDTDSMLAVAPESQIYTLTFGDSCNVIFNDRYGDNKTELKVSDNTIYSMSAKS